MGVPARTICEEKPRSQKRDLGHPLKVWSLQLRARSARKIFPRKSVHTEISPLRYASVPRHAGAGEMTKGRVVIDQSKSYWEWIIKLRIAILFAEGS